MKRPFLRATISGAKARTVLAVPFRLCRSRRASRSPASPIAASSAGSRHRRRRYRSCRSRARPDRRSAAAPRCPGCRHDGLAAPAEALDQSDGLVELFRSGRHGVRRRRYRTGNIDGDDVRAVGGHFDRDRAPDASGGAGHDGDLVLQHRTAARLDRPGAAFGRRLGHRLAVQLPGTGIGLHLRRGRSRRYERAGCRCADQNLSSNPVRHCSPPSTASNGHIALPFQRDDSAAGERPARPPVGTAEASRR